MDLGSLIVLLKLAGDTGFTVSPKTEPTATFFDLPPETKTKDEIKPIIDTVPTCKPGENLTWIPGSQKYVCLPSLK